MSFITPDWPAPEQVNALSTCCDGGVSAHGYASFNIATHVGDDILSVAENRKRLVRDAKLPAEPVWLEQAHGTTVAVLGGARYPRVIEADASIARCDDRICAVMTADCLPILLCKQDGSAVAAVHAGWRGLLSGVIENTINALGEPQQILAWLGPAIGPGCFEVGAEVKGAFSNKKAVMGQAFQQIDEAHYMADLYALARMTLLHNGVKKMYGGEHCTYNQPDQFYSYRRQPITGRMASLIWLQS
ncbi:MAG: multi-copper polyphenol oxidoreductase [Piscirickettsiaceae bacterium]|nr:MAG: multi-copper polyphenol oxidoreductase [Piscirickettsiaceae bacterium]